jgi:hypothetical protein
MTKAKEKCLLLPFLSDPRMISYKLFFKTENEQDLIGCYLWNEAVSSALSTPLNLFELALRNQIHLTLSQADKGATAKSTDWYAPGKKILPGISADSQAKIDKHLYDQVGNLVVPAPNPNDVVASLSFGVWKNIIEVIPKAKASFWIPSIFPTRGTSHAVAEWSANDRKRVNALAQDIGHIKHMRNRIAHMEPVWTLQDRYDGVGKPKRRPNNPSESLQALRRFHDFLQDSLSWFSNDLREGYRNTYAYGHANALLTTDAVYAFATQAGKCEGMPVRFPSRQRFERAALSTHLRTRT